MTFGTISMQSKRTAQELSMKCKHLLVLTILSSGTLTVAAIIARFFNIKAEDLA
jgi:hypothetical protein